MVVGGEIVVEEQVIIVEDDDGDGVKVEKKKRVSRGKKQK